MSGLFSGDDDIVIIKQQVIETHGDCLFRINSKGKGCDNLSQVQGLLSIRFSRIGN